jgi:gluconokinase
MNLLAIEISTASAKALLYSVGQGVKKVKSIPFDQSICDIASQDPEGVFNALIGCVKEIIKDEPEPIEALGICTTWHSLLLLDERRNPIGRIYTWANSKASQSVKKYRQSAELCNWYYQRAGCMVNSTYPFWQYIHFRDTDPGLCQKARFLSSQQEYVFEKLTGEVAASRCTASGSGFLNTRTLDWDQDVLEFASIKREQLASLKEPTYVAPLKNNIAKVLGLRTGIPVIIGGADGALNQIGDGAVQEGIMTFSVGTSGALRLVSNEVVLPASPSTWCYYLAEGKHIVGGSTSSAGNCVEWFNNKMSFREKFSYADLEGMVKEVDPKNAPIFLPFLYGERCPGWVDNRLGGFFDLSSEHGIGDMYYAVLEGVLFNLYHCYTLLTELMEQPQKILVSGGIVRSNFWVQMVADIFQREMHISNIPHVSLLGAVALICKSLNLVSEIGQDQLGSGAMILPNKAVKDIYRQRFEKYLALYNA